MACHRIVQEENYVFHHYIQNYKHPELFMAKSLVMNDHYFLNLKKQIKVLSFFLKQTTANCFCTSFKDVEDLSKQGTFGKARWFNTVKKEYNACRKGVAIIDMTSFTKYELKSADRSVVNFLQMLCANNIDKPIGTVIHTGMLNEHGGYENDCSVIRLGDYQ